MGRISRSYVGFKSGKLTIIEDLGKDENGKRICRVQCECGNTKVISLWSVLYGRTRSCGCLQTIARHNLGLSRRKYEKKCSYCGKEQHYSKGLCKACYNRLRNNGVLEIHKRGVKSRKMENDKVIEYSNTNHKGE